LDNVVFCLKTFINNKRALHSFYDTAQPLVALVDMLMICLILDMSLSLICQRHVNRRTIQEKDSDMSLICQRPSVDMLLTCQQKDNDMSLIYQRHVNRRTIQEKDSDMSLICQRPSVDMSLTCQQKDNVIDMSVDMSVS